MCISQLTISTLRALNVDNTAWRTLVACAAQLINCRAFGTLVKCAARLTKCADWPNACNIILSTATLANSGAAYSLHYHCSSTAICPYNCHWFHTLVIMRMLVQHDDNRLTDVTSHDIFHIISHNLRLFVYMLTWCCHPDKHLRIR